MAPDNISAVWIPVCCGRVMRCNMFRLADGGAYALLVCATCNKNITLEKEALASTDKYGEGSHVLSLLGSPKPPKVDRKSVVDLGLDEPTL